MTAVLAAGLLWSAQAGYSATFADVWERWKKVDAAWSLPESKPKKALAVANLKMASGLVFSARWSDACRELDLALAQLQGIKPSPEQAVILRFKPPVCEPGKAARLAVTWAYRPEPYQSLPLKIGNREVILHPSRPLTIEVMPQRLEPELTQNPELGIPIAAQVGSTTRTVFLSILKSPRQRIAALLKDPNTMAQALGKKALILMDATNPAESSVSILSAIGLGEGFVSGRVKLSQLDSVPYAQQGETSLQLAIPKGPSRTVVVGISGFGGESGFFDNFGQGAAAAESTKRGWIFVGASMTETAVADALAWMRTRLGRTIDRYFVLGYSRGAGEGLAAMGLARKPAAIGLLAPASTTVPQGWMQGPLYFAVGKQDAARVYLPILSIVRELGERKDVKLFEVEDCEHMMLPSEAIKSAFEFFDGFAKPPAPLSTTAPRR